jgi:hypothetical protein
MRRKVYVVEASTTPNSAKNYSDLSRITKSISDPRIRPEIVFPKLGHGAVNAASDEQTGWSVIQPAEQP